MAERAARRAAWGGAVCVIAAAFWSAATAQQPVTDTAREVNRKLVKLFGIGGVKGLPSYGTGILVSPKGYILTVNNHILSTSDLRVHLYDGRAYSARTVAKEPDLDLAIVKIDEDVDFLGHYDIAAAASKPLAEPGDWILAFTNCFKIATRDEPMSVQRGVIAAYSELRGRRGVFDAPFAGEAYFLDAVANNPGAAGGALVNRKGELLGVIGRELRNSLTDTWINYAVPVQAKVEYPTEDKKTATIDVAGFVKQVLDGKFVQREKTQREDRGGYLGIVLVPNPVSATPPYVEEVVPGSPAALAGLRPDDLIVYVDGELAPTVKNFRELLKSVAPGTEIKLDVQRGLGMKSFKMKAIDTPKVKAGN